MPDFAGAGMTVARLTVCVMAKEPEPGRVKTRLCPPLGPAEAAALHAAFVMDTLSWLLAAGRWRIVVAASPDFRAPWLVGLARRLSVELVWQGGGDLGVRMQRVLTRECGVGEPVVVLGADTPDLPVAYIDAASDALDGRAAVLGPSQDGGYYLFGCSTVVPPVFVLRTPWGGDKVFDETLAQLLGAAVPTTVLPTWEDVDDGRDLQALRRRISLCERSEESLAATREMLARLDDVGFPG